MRTTVTLTCHECGKSYERHPCKVPGSRHCSKECRNACGVRKAGAVLTHKIGNTFRAGKRPANAFRSEDVRGRNSPKWVEPLRFTCRHCSGEFERKPWEVRRTGGVGLYCSKQCRDAYRHANEAGPNSPHWVGGKTSYDGKHWQRARLQAVERDGGTCQDCGLYLGTSIPVHHVRPYREYADHEDPHELSNLICLCQSCHMKREPRPRRRVAAAD